MHKNDMSDKERQDYAVRRQFLQGASVFEAVKSYNNRREY